MHVAARAQDAGLPNWLQLGGSARIRQEAPAGSDFIASSSAYYLLSRVRFDAGIKPRKGIRLFVQLQDSHILGLDAALRPSSRNPIDLRQAYLELSRPHAFNIRAGRQEIRFGSGRMMSPGEFSNVSRTFDILRATVIVPFWTVDVVAGSVVQIDPTRFDRHRPGDHVFGTYLSSGKSMKHVRVEPYFFTKRVLNVSGETGSTGDAVVYAPGVRLVGINAAGWQWSAEGVKERGHWAADSVRGFAYMLTLGYVFRNRPGSPRVSGDYNYAAGDNNPSDGVRGGMEPFYGANQPYFSMTPLVGWRNMRDVRAGFDFAPWKRLRIAVDYRDLSLATTADGFYNGQNVRFLLNRGATSAHVGQAIESVATYSAPYAITIAAGFGRLFAGEYLRQSVKPSGYVYPYLSCAVRF